MVQRRQVTAAEAGFKRGGTFAPKVHNNNNKSLTFSSKNLGRLQAASGARAPKARGGRPWPVVTAPLGRLQERGDVRPQGPQQQTHSRRPSSRAAGGTVLMIRRRTLASEPGLSLSPSPSHWSSESDPAGRANESLNLTLTAPASGTVTQAGTGSDSGPPESNFPIQVATESTSTD